LALVTLAPPLLSAKQRVLKCGVNRWAIKIAADPNKSLIFINQPRLTSIQTLLQFRRPQRISTGSRSFPVEFTVYRVRGKIEQITLQNDSDLHIILSEINNRRARIVAEVPVPECAIGSRFANELLAVRKIANTLKVKDYVELEGVGFFDSRHETRAAAPNGIELHPVIRISLLRRD
jgi:hypothetical protein